MESYNILNNEPRLSNSQNHVVVELNSNKLETQRFLNRLDPDAKGFTFQTFDDSKGRKNPSLTKVLHGTLDEHWDELVFLNAQGAGIFVTVNETNLSGRTTQDMVSIRAMYREDDTGGLADLPLKPQMVVESSPGKKHEYLFTNKPLLDSEDRLDNSVREEFDGVLRRVIEGYGSDPCAKSVTRVLRVPGFWHLKDPDHPHLVKIVELNEVPRYSWEEIKAALPLVSRNIVHRVFPSKGMLPLDVSSALNSINPDCDYTDWLDIGMAVHNASGGSSEGFLVWDSWSMQGESYPDATGETQYKWESFSGYNGTPITVRTLYKKAYESGWEGLGYSELVELTNTLCADDIDRTTDVIELMGTSQLTPIEVDSLLKKIKQKTSWSMGALRESFKNDRSGSGGNDQMKIFREVRSAIGDDNLIFAQSWFYKWNESGVWEKLEDIYISQRLQTHCDKAGYSYTASVIESSKKLMANSSYLKGHVFDQRSNVINCLSGELHFIVDKWESKEFDKLSYRTTQIPVEYDPDADCPRYKQFLDEVFEGEPDKEERKTLLLEMMGYSLIQSTDYEKFMILTGVGANGKSVVLNILIAMLGQRQVSGVRPTQLDNKFQVAHLHGKLANVVTELPEGAEY